MVCYVRIFDTDSGAFVEFDSRPNVGDRIWLDIIPELKLFSQQVQDHIGEQAVVVSDIVWGMVIGGLHPDGPNRPYWVLQCVIEE